jgi:EAL and modified HD-GYP domain-containing signal transduction protein
MLLVNYTYKPIFDIDKKIKGYVINTNESNNVEEEILNLIKIDKRKTLFFYGNKENLQVLFNYKKIMNKVSIILDTKDLEDLKEFNECYRKLKEFGYSISLYLDKELSVSLYKEIEKKVAYIFEDIKQDNLYSENIKHIKNNIQWISFNTENSKLLEKAIKENYDYFEGSFYKKMEFYSNELSPNKTAVLRAMKETYKPYVNIKKLTEITKFDTSISYNLLKKINIIKHERKTKIQSIEQAYTWLGDVELRKWLSLVFMQKYNDKTDEITRNASVRGKLMEELSNKKEKAFLVGLLSLADVILESPIKKILKQINVDDEIEEAILKRENDLGKLLKLVIAGEDGDWEAFMQYSNELNIDRNKYNKYLNKADDWYFKFLTI